MAAGGWQLTVGCARMIQIQFKSSPGAKCGPERRKMAAHRHIWGDDSEDAARCMLWLRPHVRPEWPIAAGPSAPRLENHEERFRIADCGLLIVDWGLKIAVWLGLHEGADSPRLEREMAVKFSL